MPITSHANVSLFADTMFYFSHLTISFAINRLQRQIDLAYQWFIKWRLKINAEKTTAVLFSCSLPRAKLITMNSQPIPWSNKVKYLGVI